MSILIDVATLIGVLAAALQLTGLRKQRQRSFEDFFVQRYWKIMDDMTLEGLTCKKPPGGQIQDADKRAVIAFLRLSEDETDLRAKGWISKETWGLWWEGIVTQLHRWPFDEVWDQVCHDEDEAKLADLFSTLRDARAHIRALDMDYDPRPRSWRRSSWWWPFGGP